MKNPITEILEIGIFNKDQHDAFGVYDADTDVLIKVFSKDRFTVKKNELYMERDGDNDSGCVWSSKTGKKLDKTPSSFININVQYYDFTKDEIVEIGLNRIDTYIKLVYMELEQEDRYDYIEIDHEEYEYQPLNLIQSNLNMDFGQNVEVVFYPDFFKVKYIISDPFEEKFDKYNEKVIRKARAGKKQRQRKEKIQAKIGRLQKELKSFG